MNARTYRLDAYKIIESDSGLIIWEAHSGFGELQTGPCFKKGIILFIGPPENCRNGFLKGEFLDDLKKYPKWRETIYYCNGYDLYKCRSGRRVTKEEMTLWTLGRRLDKEAETDRHVAKNFSAHSATQKASGNGAYRLQRYEITVNADRKIQARTYSGANSVSSGNGIIIENILFIGRPQETPSNLDKRQFVEGLKQLPRWDQTDFFCKGFSLHECNPESRMRSEPKKWSYTDKTTQQHDFKIPDKNSFSTKILAGGHWTSFSKRMPEIWDSFSGLLKRTGDFGRFSDSSSINCCLRKIFSVLHETGIILVKGIIGAISILLSVITAICAFVWGHLKSRYEGWKNEKSKQ